MTDRHKHRRGERQIHKQTRRVEGFSIAPFDYRVVQLYNLQSPKCAPEICTIFSNKGSQKWPRIALYTVPVYTAFVKCLHNGLKINDDMQTISTNMDSNQVSWAINGGINQPKDRSILPS